MNLSRENMRRISDLVESGSTISLDDIKDLHGHNEHLTLLLEARGRLMLGVEIERDQLKSDVEALRRDKSEPCDGCFMADAEALRKDAARYRWLREQEAEHGVCIINVGEWTAGATCIATTFHSAEFADEMVDAAMSKEG